jgi:hypothetical protein
MPTIKEMFGYALGRADVVPASAPDTYQTYGVPDAIQPTVGHAALFSMDEQEAIFTPYATVIPQPEINHPEFGYIPNVAQQLASDIGTPKIMTPPYFSVKDLGHAVWFTTRTVLNPLGNAE